MISQTYKDVYSQSLFDPDVSPKLIKSYKKTLLVTQNSTPHTKQFSPRDSGDTYACRSHQTQLMHEWTSGSYQHIQSFLLCKTTSITNAKVLTLLVQKNPRKFDLKEWDMRYHDEGAELLKWKVKVLQRKLPSCDHYLRPLNEVQPLDITLVWSCSHTFFDSHAICRNYILSETKITSG